MPGCGGGSCTGGGRSAIATGMPAGQLIFFFKTLFLVMLISASLSSLFVVLHLSPMMAPPSMGVQIGEPKSAAANANRDDSSFTFGDFWIQDKMGRQSNFADSVVNDKSQNQIEYPTGW